MVRNTPWILNSRICWVVLFAFCTLAVLPAQGGAALVESRTADGWRAADRAELIEDLRQALEKDVVAQRLADYGLTADEVAAKLPELSDEQLHQLASLSDSLGEGGVLGAVIGVLVIVLLVVVLLKIADKEIVVR